MKKINGFTITKMSMSGFKCFEDTATFELGDMTTITASNGQGKSSIADAIAFAFAGTPFFGEKGLDRLQNTNVQEMSVRVDFIDDRGETHNLTRSRRNDVTNIAYDGINIRQTDLNSAFGDKDVFLSILNPLYFINVLGDKGKNLLEKLLPTVSHEEVLASMSQSSRELLENQKMLMPETFIKNRRAELKELEDTLIGYRSQQDLLEYQREERVSTINDLKASVGKITEEMSELIKIRDCNRDIAREESSLAELRKQREELLSDPTQKAADKAIQDTMVEIKSVEMSIKKLETAEYVSSYVTQIAEIEAELKLLYGEHARLNKALSDIVVGYKCPTCAIVITAENIEAVKQDLQDRVSALINDGKTAKTRLAEVKAADTKEKQEYETQNTATLKREREKLVELNQQLQDMNVARELDTEDYRERLLSLENQISDYEYRLSNGNWIPEQVQQIADFDSEKKEFEAKIEALCGISDYNYSQLITDTETEIARLKRLINEAVYYLARRIELMLDGLKMSNTEIVLTEIIKTTGEVKDCFRFSYDGRDYRCLSLSEKVRAGLDVSLLMQRLTGRNYPIFVDNGESICSFGNVIFTGQMIFARVVRNHELHVTYKNREQQRLAA